MSTQTPQPVRGVYAYAVVLLASVVVALMVSDQRVFAQSSAPGGFVQTGPTLTAAPVLSAATIQGFLPARGRFAFPAPYNTEAVRLTNASDCVGGGDCVRSVGYAYWRNINNHVNSDTMLIALGLDRSKGGAGPTLFSFNKSTGETKNLGALFAPETTFGYGTTEGWYFSATLPTALYVNDSAKLLRYDVLTHQFTAVFDATTFFGPNHIIWQAHSSNDDQVHSFTLKDGSTYADLGCGVYLEGTAQFRFFPARGDYDECQIDKSGRYLVIKENADGAQGEDNVIEDLLTGAEQLLTDPAGAGGHSDAGFGYQVAEDNFGSVPGSARVWTLGTPPTDGSQGRLVFRATDWNWGNNHIAHGNARPDLSLSQQHVCSSDANRLNVPGTNQVLCYRLDGSLNVLVVAPIMTDLNASGGGDDYWKLPKGNLDVTGEWFIWSSNMGGARQDTFMVRIPLGMLPPPIDGSATPGTTAPTPAPVATDPVVSAPSTAVTWVQQVNTSLSGDTLRKVSGCDGCADAGAASAQQITSGDGYLEVTATETGTTRSLGLSTGNTSTAGEEIAFGLWLRSNYVEVREKGLYRADTSFVPGDVFRVQVSGGRVSYLKNGIGFYTSTVAPTYPLLVDATFNSLNSSLSRVLIAGTAMTTSSAPAPAPVPIVLSWVNTVNASLVNGRLQKTSGCNGCPDAGGVSLQQITSGTGYIEFSPGSAVGMFLVGLGSSSFQTPQTEFGLRIRNGAVEVREAGVYRAGVRVAAKDLLRITVNAGKVTYARNGKVFWTSAVTAAYPLRADATLYDLNVYAMPVTFLGR